MPSAQAIPADVQALIKAAGRGRFVRSDVAAAEAAMAKLDIRADTEFYAVASRYLLGSLHCEHDGEALVDVSAPTEQVAVATAFARSGWELPDDYICFTSCQGEGGYLYSITTGGVFDFTLAERDEFLRNPVAQWRTFFGFLRWYLSPDERIDQ